MKSCSGCVRLVWAFGDEEKPFRCGIVRGRFDPDKTERCGVYRLSDEALYRIHIAKKKYWEEHPEDLERIRALGERLRGKSE